MHINDNSQGVRQTIYQRGDISSDERQFPKERINEDLRGSQEKHRFQGKAYKVEYNVHTNRSSKARKLGLHESDIDII